MPVAAPLIIGGASVASGLIGASAAGKAADAQARAAAESRALQERMYEETKANYAPYLNIGKGATYTLGSLYGIGTDGNQSNANVDYSQFYSSPDYEFARQQGQLGLDRYLNSRGMALSGGALKDTAQFNQGLATQQFGNYFNRLLSLSQLGSNAAANAGNAAAGFSGQMSNSIQGQGQAQAAGYVGQANAMTGALNSGVSNSLLYNAMNRSSYATPSSNIGYGTSSNGWLGNTGAPGWISP